MRVIGGVKDLVVWGVLIIGSSWLFSDFKGVSNNSVVASLIPSQGYHTDTEAHFYKSVDGHFYIETTINNENVVFLLDTGATDIALSSDDAQKIGIDLERINYTKTYNTANGVIKSAPVSIENIEIGNFLLTDVPASVSNGKLDVSLFGMSALERFRFIVDGNKLVLSAPKS